MRRRVATTVVVLVAFAAASGAVLAAPAAPTPAPGQGQGEALDDVVDLEETGVGEGLADEAVAGEETDTIPAVTRGEVRSRLDRIYASPRYQTEYPEPGELPEAPDLDLSPWVLEAMRWVLYGVLVLGVGLLVYLVYSILRSPPVPAPEEPEEPLRVLPPEPEPAPPAALPDPEALAAAGRFGEAVHALLLHAVPLLAARRRSPWPAGTTGREILATSGLEGAARRGFSLLVSAVEHFLFARRPLTEEDWLVCQGAFQSLRSQLASPLATPGAEEAS